jgi:hypothetical protein
MYNKHIIPNNYYNIYVEPIKSLSHITCNITLPYIDLKEVRIASHNGSIVYCNKKYRRKHNIDKKDIYVIYMPTSYKTEDFVDIINKITDINDIDSLKFGPAVKERLKIVMRAIKIQRLKDNI